MQEVFRMFDKKMITEGRKILLFLDNALSHPNILQEGLKKIKLKFLPKSTTWRLQPCDAGIIKKFNHKYRKLLTRYILAGMATSNDVSILKVIEWIQKSWVEVNENTIKNCFEKCGFGKPDVVADETVDHDLMSF